VKPSFKSRYNGFVVGALLFLALSIIWDSKPFAIGATILVLLEVLFNIEYYKPDSTAGSVKNTPFEGEKKE
jgi:hypothetical protein